jgi:hypothetical protein
LNFKETVKAESPYQRAAAEWVARYNASSESGVRGDSPLKDANRITGVTFQHVGAYCYSEMTYDYGSAGISYTFWEELPKTKKHPTRFRAVNIEIRWSDGYDAGKFIEECVRLMNEAKQ